MLELYAIGKEINLYFMNINIILELNIIGQTTFHMEVVILKRITFENV